MTLTIPLDIAWELVLLSIDSRVSSSLGEIQTRWTLADIYRTQQALSDVDRAQKIYMDNQRRGSKWR